MPIIPGGRRRAGALAELAVFPVAPAERVYTSSPGRFDGEIRHSLTWQQTSVACLDDEARWNMVVSIFAIEGGCTCGNVRYRMKERPLVVHCCHCRWCQRETGASFALNAMIEANRVELLSGEPETIVTPSLSGKGQKISRCPKCRVAVWSNYAGSGDLFRFVRVGTLDSPDTLPPDVHIFTTSKQPWVTLSPTVPAFEEFYVREEIWPAASLSRWRAARGSGVS